MRLTRCPHCAVSQAPVGSPSPARTPVSKFPVQLHPVWLQMTREQVLGGGRSPAWRVQGKAEETCTCFLRAEHQRAHWRPQEVLRCAMGLSTLPRARTTTQWFSPTQFLKSKGKLEGHVHFLSSEARRSQKQVHFSRAAAVRAHRARGLTWSEHTRHMLTDDRLALSPAWPSC